MWKDLLCLNEMENIILCGRKVDGQGRTIVLLMQLVIHHFGPFKRIGKILQQDPAIATGAGHHSVIHIPGTDKWYIVYHRRPLGETDGNSRVVCIDKMYFDAKGFIKPVVITKEGVDKFRLNNK